MQLQRLASPRQGDQRCRHRAPSGLCRSSFREQQLDRERCRRSCGGERHTLQGDQRCRRRAASGLCRPSFRGRERQRGSRALPMQLRRRASHPTRRSAVHMSSRERPMQLNLPRARAVALIESVADAAAAASVTPDRAISGADTEQRAACAAQASEREKSSVDRERR